MRTIISIFTAILLYVFSNTVIADSDQTTINLQVIHSNYVRLIGTAAGITKTFDVNEVRPVSGNRGPGPTVSIGQLGLESNISGNCTLDFSTTNGFRLRHLVSGRRLTSYRLNYSGNRINRRNTSMVLASCNEAVSSLDFTATGRFRRNVSSGIYRDIVTITVTTQ